MNIWKRQHHNRHHAQPWDEEQDEQANRKRPCPVCNGRGKVETVTHDKDDKEVVIMDWCAACGGDGEA